MPQDSRSWFINHENTVYYRIIPALERRRGNFTDYGLANKTAELSPRDEIFVLARRQGVQLKNGLTA